MYSTWGDEGDVPFLVRGVINVGFCPHDDDFVFKVSSFLGAGGK